MTTKLTFTFGPGRELPFELPAFDLLILAAEHKIGGTNKLIEVTGIPPATMFRLKSGSSRPKVKHLRALCRVLDIPLGWVLSKEAVEEFELGELEDKDEV